MEQLSYLGLTAHISNRKFEVSDGNNVIESIRVPANLLTVYRDAARRNLVVLDYLDRVCEDRVAPMTGSDFLKKFAVEMNRELKGILTLDSLEDNEMILSGIQLSINRLADQTYLKVASKDVVRNFPYNIGISVKLLKPIFLVAALRKADTCCGGKKKQQ